MRHKLAAAFVLASTACATSIAYSADETQARTFNLTNATIAQAATVLRTIAETQNLVLADHTITVRDTEEKLELAAAVVEMLNGTDAAETTPLSAGDGHVIVVVDLNRASSGEVIAALQKELRFARSAGAGEKRVFLRDTDSQVHAALKVIERLERSHAQP